MKLAKISNVAGYIDSIQSGVENPWTINVSVDDNAGYTGGTITATQGELSVTGNIEDKKCSLPIPKSGTWAIKSSNEASSRATVNIQDTYTISLNCVCNATIIMKVTNNSNYRISGYVYDSVLSQLKYGFIDKNVSNTISCSITKFGTYRTRIDNGLTGNKGKSLDKLVGVFENKTYEVQFIVSNSSTISDPTSPDQPSIDGEPPNAQENESEPVFYAVNTTDMSNDQIEEIFNHIDEMIQQNKTQNEIEDYIASKEQEYSNSI